jgi:hypothetical protein
LGDPSQGLSCHWFIFLFFTLDDNLKNNLKIGILLVYFEISNQSISKFDVVFSIFALISGKKYI